MIRYGILSTDVNINFPVFSGFIEKHLLYYVTFNA